MVDNTEDAFCAEAINKWDTVNSHILINRDWHLVRTISIYELKREVVLSQVVESYRWTGGTAPFILNLDTAWRWVNSLTPRPLCEPGRVLVIPGEYEDGWASETVVVPSPPPPHPAFFLFFWEEMCFAPARIRAPDRSAHRLVAVETTIFRHRYLPFTVPK